MRVLIPLPDKGFDVTETAVPWKLLTAAGHTVTFATEKGTIAQGDPLLLKGVIFGQLGAASEAKEYYHQMVHSAEFQAPLHWQTIQPTDFDGIILPGGHAPGMRQYLGSEVLQQKIAAFWQLDRPVGAICHGVLVLARAIDPSTQQSAIATKQTTCLPKYMERLSYFITAWKLGRYYRTYPAYVEDEVKAALLDKHTFQRGPFVLTRRGTQTDSSPAFVVQDGNYLSARWPGDAYLFAQRFIALLK